MVVAKAVSMEELVKPAAVGEFVVVVKVKEEVLTVVEEVTAAVEFLVIVKNEVLAVVEDMLKRLETTAGRCGGRCSAGRRRGGRGRRV